MKKLTLLIVITLLAGCSKNIQNNEAVRQSVVDYLKGRTAQTGLDISLMQVDVTAVSFAKDEARATVYFRPKNSPEGGGMAMNYVLDRKGNKWVVKGRQDSASNPHGGAPTTGSGAAMPPLPEMPSGHPSTGAKPGAASGKTQGGGKEAPSGVLPPDHPHLGSAQ